VSLYITDECINCGACEPECPTQAISAGEQIYLIDPELCTECYGVYDHHACQSVCPVECCLLDPTQPESHASLKERTERIDPAAAGRWSSTQVEEWIAGRTRQVASMAAKSPAGRSWQADAAARDAERVAGMKACRERLAGLRGNADATAWRELIEQVARVRGGISELAPEILAAAPDACFVEIATTLQSSALSPQVVGAEARLRAIRLAYAAKDRRTALALLVHLPVDRLTEVANTTPGLVRQAIAQRLKAPLTESERWELAVLAATRGYERELRQAVVVLAAGRPRLWRHENASTLAKLSPRISAVIDSLILEAPSAAEMLKRAGVCRVRGSSTLYVEETDELVESLDEVAWDPDEPGNRAAEATRVIRRLPYAKIASGTVRARRRNALNNPGVEWNVRWSEKARTATVTLQIAGDDFSERIARVASMAKAIAIAKQRAGEAQDSIDDNSV
jgi:hypothetical protein